MDILTKAERSRRMGRVRSKRNRSTEWRVRSALMREGIRGWKMNVGAIAGTPDFVFSTKKLVIFVDGCFWHGCPKCARPVPRGNRSYWALKLKANIARARRVSRRLHRAGFTVIRIWEHEVRSTRPLRRLLAILHA